MSTGLRSLVGHVAAEDLRQREAGAGGVYHLAGVSARDNDSCQLSVLDNLTDHLRGPRRVQRQEDSAAWPTKGAEPVSTRSKPCQWCNICRAYCRNILGT